MAMNKDELKSGSATPALDDRQTLYNELAMQTDSKIIFLIADGLGGMPDANGKTELETANTPNLDKLAASGVTGRTIPIRPGVTPGSGPAHFSLFGYDPLTAAVGRGALSAYGIGKDLVRGDVALRMNYCTVVDGLVTDRRAGRIPDELNRTLSARLNEIKLPGVELKVITEKEYRSVVLLLGGNLDASVSDTDPQRTGTAPLTVSPLTEAAGKTADLINSFLEQARNILADQEQANFVLTRGAATLPDLPTIEEVWKLKCKGIAAYPMYKGISRLLGMDVDISITDLDGELQELEKTYKDYDYFFFHFKKTDSAGEDGDFDRKVAEIEKFDKIIPQIMALNPAALVITGDHSTPALLKNHSWHPVPFLMVGAHVIPDEVTTFGERACMRGGYQLIPAYDLMPMAMAVAGKLGKYGA
jgi:2,3-bisphosphoglycerate-independent phosphoglycerate mutase